MKFKEEMQAQMDSRRQSEIGGEMLISDDEIKSTSPLRKLTLQVSGTKRPGRIIEANQPMTNY
jgi:hypothetical protein